MLRMTLLAGYVALALVALGLGAVCLRRHHQAGYNVYFTPLAITTGLWLACLAVAQIVSSDILAYLHLAQVVLMNFLPAFFLLFVLRALKYVTRLQWLPTAALCAVPVFVSAVMLLVIGMLDRMNQVAAAALWSKVGYAWLGPWLMGQLAYGLGALLAAVILLMSRHQFSRRFFQQQTGWILLALALVLGTAMGTVVLAWGVRAYNPAVIDGLGSALLSDAGEPSLIAFGFTLTLGLLYWAMFHYDTNDVAMPARGLVFDLLPEMLLFLDEDEVVVDANRLAKEQLRLGKPDETQHFTSVINRWLDAHDGEWMSIQDANFLFLQTEDRKACFQMDKHPLTQNGEQHGYAVIINDVSVMHHMLETLRSQANHDTLTGLPNRRAFDNKSRELMREAQYPFVIVLVDLDHLKRINDLSGHAAGDRAICHVASVLARNTPPGGLAARIGGDEFAMLLPRMDQVQAEQLTAQMLTEVRQYMLPYQVRMSASFGCAVMRGPDQAIIDVYETADKRMYVQKLLHHAGRD